MEYEKALAVLKNLQVKHPLDAEEQEAVSKAIGVLSIGALTMSHIKEKKAKREKATEW